MKSRLLLTLALGLASLSLTSLSMASEAQVTESVAAAPKVIMYTTKTCGYCAKARTLFTSHNVAWDERDIEASATANKEWKELGGVGTPLILINGKRFSGYLEAQLEAELAMVK